MGIGTGILLIAVGAVLSWAVDVDLPYIADDAMGVILIVAGGIAVVATVIMSMQRTRHRPAARDGYGPGQPYHPQQGNRW
jgi:hypothetical protein